MAAPETRRQCQSHYRAGRSGDAGLVLPLSCWGLVFLSPACSSGWMLIFGSRIAGPNQLAVDSRGELGCLVIGANPVARTKRDLTRTQTIWVHARPVLRKLVYNPRSNYAHHDMRPSAQRAHQGSFAYAFPSVAI